MTKKLNIDNGLQGRLTRTTGYNRRLAQWRVKWLIEHSTSHQLLWYIDNFVLRNLPLRQAPNRYGQLYETTTKRTGTTRRLTLKVQLTSQWTTLKPLHKNNFQTLKSNK